MTLTDTEIDLIRSGFAELRTDLRPRSLSFYEALFRRAPELKPMFREDLTGQGMRFMATLGILVDNLDDMEGLSRRCAELGGSHRALGVKAEYFEPMGDALIETLGDALGGALTAEAEMAWRKAYRSFADRIIAAGHIR